MKIVLRLFRGVFSALVSVTIVLLAWSAFLKVFNVNPFIGKGPTDVYHWLVTTDKAAVYPRVLDELAPGAWHCTEAYANNRMEADHGQLKRRLRPMRGLKTDHGARIIIIAGHAFVQNVRRGHYELGVDEPVILRLVAAFDELALAI